MPAPKILTFVNNYIPSYKSGGPVRSISNITSLLKDDIDMKVICYDRDAGDNEPFSNIKTGEWNTGPNGQDILYLQAGFYDWLRSLIINTYKVRYHGIYLNTFFGIRYSLVPIILYLLGILRADKVILAPRGELMPGALTISKFKKIIFIYCFRTFGLSKLVTFQCTSHDEVVCLKKFFPGVKHNLVENIPKYDAANFSRKRDIFDEAISLVYISRVSRKKNISFLIDILNFYDGKKKITLDIYGPANGKDKIYLRESMGSARESNAFKVNYKGAINYEDVQDCLKKYDFFVLPTLGENFGHAIADAILAGVPLIISDFTPFYDVEEHKVGHIIDINSAELSKEKLFSILNEYDYNHYNENVFREYAHFKFKIDETRVSYIKLFGILDT